MQQVITATRSMYTQILGLVLLRYGADSFVA